MPVRIKLLLFLFLITGARLMSQTEPARPVVAPLEIPELQLPVNFDGVPDEEAWNKITPVHLIMFSPVFGKEPTESTDIRIGYNSQYLFVSGEMRFSDPSMVRSASLKRDYMGMSGDWFGLILDTFNDKENGLAFFTSPDGLRFDAHIQRDAVTYMPDQQPMNINWNAFWDVRTKRNAGGWSAEIRIPLSSLRFQVTGGVVRMGLILQRWIPAKNELDIFPSIPPNWGQGSNIKPSQAKEITLKGLVPDKPLYIAPYVLGGYSASNDLNDSETAYFKSTRPVTEAGLDVKYGLTNNLVMDLTANTDFAQVEADDQMINLSRFSLYFPEKRMFFLERSSIFDFALDGNSNLFYSRRIGLSDDGDPIRIYGGLRVTGRLKKWDTGLLDMQTAPLWKKSSLGSKYVLQPSENFGAVRFRRQVINENSYIGTMVTSRLGADGSYNVAYGIDGIVRLFGEDYLNFRWAQTFEDSVRNKSIDQPTMIQFSWERRAKAGLGYNFSYARSGVNFNPGIGFEMLDDYAAFFGSLSYGWISPEKSKLYSHSPEIMVIYNHYVDDGSLMSVLGEAGWQFQTKNQWMVSLNGSANDEILRDSLEILENKVYVPPARYEYYNFRGLAVTPSAKPFYLMINTQIGQYYDGNRISVGLQPTWNVSKHLEFGGTYNLDHVAFDRRDVRMTNHIVGFKALYMPSTRLSFSAFIQYNTAINEIISNVRFRYNPKEGNDFYIVLNEGRNTRLTGEMPNLPVYNSRAIMVKYTYTFNL